MAEILNNKTEVISVELTKHGRKKLAEGLFSPEYYMFFDDTVIYDDKYTGYNSENTNEIQDKILYNSINTRFLNLLDDKEIISENLMPLGTSNANNDYAPAWDLRLLKGTIQEISASSTYFKKIIALNDVESQASLQTTNLINYDNRNNSTFELEDGRVLVLDNQYLLIELSEENVDDDYKNFDIELFTYDELYGGKEKNLKRKLLFTETQNNIIDGILYDPSELPSTFIQEKITEKDAEFYLDVLVDDEIDTNIISATEKAVQDQIKPTYKQNVIATPKEDC